MITMWKIDFSIVSMFTLLFARFLKKETFFSIIYLVTVISRWICRLMSTTNFVSTFHCEVRLLLVQSLISLEFVEPFKLNSWMKSHKLRIGVNFFVFFPLQQIEIDRMGLLTIVNRIDVQNNTIQFVPRHERWSRTESFVYLPCCENIWFHFTINTRERRTREIWFEPSSAKVSIRLNNTHVSTFFHIGAHRTSACELLSSSLACWRCWLKWAFGRALTRDSVWNECECEKNPYL